MNLACNTFLSYYRCLPVIHFYFIRYQLFFKKKRETNDNCIIIIIRSFREIKKRVLLAVCLSLFYSCNFFEKIEELQIVLMMMLFFFFFEYCFIIYREKKTTILEAELRICRYFNRLSIALLRSTKQSLKKVYCN